MQARQATKVNNEKASKQYNCVKQKQKQHTQKTKNKYKNNN